MSDFETAARPYARAIFELASDEGKLQAWQDKLELAASIAADAGMSDLLQQPAMIPGDLAGLFRSVMQGAGDETDSDFDNLISLLAETAAWRRCRR